MQIPTFLVYK